MTGSDGRDRRQEGAPPGSLGPEGGQGASPRKPQGPTGRRRPPLPTRAEVVKGVTRELAQAPDDAGIERPRLEAERLVCHVLGIERAELAAAGDEEMDPRGARRLARVVSRRARGEPLQHIEGTVQFRDLVLVADRRALIPRPETEQLVDQVKSWAKERARASGETVRVGRRGDEPLLDRVLDMGTGSGAIALSLVKEGIAAGAVGLDVSSEALLQAAANRAAAGLGEEEVEFRLVEADVWSGVGREERFDAVVSNPPYVTDAEMEELPAQITEHEPRVALSGGADGLDVVRTIVEKAAGYLRPGGALFLEIGAEQGDAVRSLLENHGAWWNVKVLVDLAGRDRFVVARVPESPPPGDGDRPSASEGGGGDDVDGEHREEEPT